MVSAGQKGNKEPWNGMFLASSCVSDTSPPLHLKKKKKIYKNNGKENPNKQNNEQTDNTPTKQPGSSH